MPSASKRQNRQATLETLQTAEYALPSMTDSPAAESRRTFNSGGNGGVVIAMIVCGWKVLAAA
jgi:hypothetical protein